MVELGRRVYAQNVAVRGLLDESGWRAFLIDAIQAMRMTPSGEAAVWRYPTEDGKGGNGLTLCQPMTESFAVVDVWDDWDGAYLHISSCKRFDVADLVAPIQAYGLGMHEAAVQQVLGL